MGRGPRALGRELDGVIARLGLSGVVERHDVFREWVERVGPEIARVARPHRVDGDTLIVLVCDSVWMNELSLRQKELLARLNEDREHTIVQRVLFRLDPSPAGTDEAENR